MLIYKIKIQHGKVFYNYLIKEILYYFINKLIGRFYTLSRGIGYFQVTR